MKIELKKEYDTTKKDDAVGSQVSSEIMSEFRAFVKANRLVMYVELNKAVLFYLDHISRLTDRGMRKFLAADNEKWGTDKVP